MTEAERNKIWRDPMPGWTVARWAGVLGIASTAVQVIGSITFIAAGTPLSSFADPQRVLDHVRHGRILIGLSVILFLTGLTLTFGFVAALWEVLNSARSKHRWLATTMLVSGSAGLVMACVAFGLVGVAVAEAGTVGAAAGSVRTLFEAGGVLGAAPALIPFAVFLGAAGYAIAETRILPRWTAVIGWVASVLLMIASLSLLGGTNPAAFWSATGLVTDAAALLFYVWTVATSIALLRLPQQVRVGRD
jgi:hypothetical protein